MKNILFATHAMELGGAENALLGLLENIDYSEYEVDLFLMRHEGILMDCIPEQVHLLPQIKEYSCLAVPLISLIKNGQFPIAFGRLRAKMLAKSFVKKHHLKKDNAVELEYSHKYTKKYMPFISGKEYDLVVSFLTPHYLAAEKVKAKRKVAWIHTDYSFISIDTVSELRMWGAFDKIASISDDAARAFSSVFPTLTEKVVTIQNIIPEKRLRSLVDAFSVNDEMPDDGCVKLLSIGRFCNAKNFDNIPEICKKIRKAGLNAKWYIIGFGNEEYIIRERIRQFEMQDHVIILGRKENPYPYIKACDIYVQPSRYEGKCVSVIEAQILHKPVIITDYPTSSSQLKDGYDGIIVPLDNQGCAEGIARVINDPQLQQKLIENTKKKDYSNKQEVEKLFALI